MSTPADLCPPHDVSVPIPLRWSDTDAFGHVDNTAFLRSFEDARSRRSPPRAWAPAG
ncbi:hypothetical protein [Kineococcus siccus]|uniref:hypothetical protein n=1 Tax=Kineococcus siccus TaxID=2696567 RepID=UPI00196B2452|nr:hypothetical protein [Kineococcus siccus]